jgi:hypothetical protein
MGRPRPPRGCCAMGENIFLMVKKTYEFLKRLLDIFEATKIILVH